MSQYKVFLCHNSNDKPQVREIREQLRQKDIETWMDEKDLIGFDAWEKKIKEEIIPQVNAVPVFLGASGFGEWQREEIRYTKEEINRRANNKLPPLRTGLVILGSCQQTFQEIRDNYYHTPYGWLFKHHTVDLRTSKAPMKELIEAITGQPWQVDDLSSERSINYTQLRDLLKAGQWKEADEETLAVMLKATGREQQGWLDYESIEKFPCTDLRTIDQLWEKYSGERFGFSVQKRIWESVGEDYEKFGDRVGWRKWNIWWVRDYNKLTFLNATDVAPKGHLPARIAWRVETQTTIWPVSATGAAYRGVEKQVYLRDRSVATSLLSRPDL